MTALGKVTMLIVIATVLATSKVEARIFERCQLARELLRLGIPRNEVKNWVCIAEHESTYNTAAIGRLNTDSSADYGLFQINDRYWCSGTNPSSSNGCKIPCNSLIDDDITNDVSCARLIEREQGLSAWVAWNRFCSGRNLDSYTAGCGI